MNFLKPSDRDCMRVGRTREQKIEKRRSGVASLRSTGRKIARNTERCLTRRRITELFFESCLDCKKMAAIPQGAFAACKVHRNEERNILLSGTARRENATKEGAYNMRPTIEGWELMPLKYNSKLMNSIWGLYNRYSVHNFKKNADDGGVFAAVWEIIKDHPPAASASIVAATAATKTSSVLGTGNGF